MNTRNHSLYALLALALMMGNPPAQALGLQEAISGAQANDPWLQGSLHRQQALAAQGTAAGTLPDPMVSLGFANLPTDTFNFDQEAMTQFAVGVSQAIPRGDSRALQQQQFEQLGEQHPLQRQDRRARVAMEVSQLWLEGYRASNTIHLIERDRALFEQLLDVAESSYASALGRTRQQDLVRAQLELTRLEDRLAQLYSERDMARARLAEWLGSTPPADAGWPEQAPALALARPAWFQPGSAPTAEQIGAQLLQHPAVRSLDARIAASATGENLAEQQYRPEWKINASYGYRDDTPMGAERADFFSIGVAFDLPLFTGNRQDQQLQSAVASTAAARTDRALLLRSMLADFEAQRARLLRLEERRTLYRERLLEEMHQQAEASLSAYTADDGDFAEVVRARIAELNAHIDALAIDTQRLQTIARLNYYFTDANGDAS